MEKNAEKNILLSKGTALIMASLILLSSSCNNDKPKGLIPEKALSGILYEVHLADGLISLPGIREKYYSRDSVSNYTDIVEDHGYTQEALDRTLHYYFTREPKKLIRIYDKTIGRLTEMDIMLENEIIDIPSVDRGLWKGEQEYFITGRGDTSKLYFDHIFYTAGNYVIQYTLTLFPSDQSVNPCLTAFTCRADSLGTGKCSYIRGMEYIKDGQPHTYNHLILVPDNLPLLIRGHILDFGNNTEDIFRHARIQDISFRLISMAK